MESCNVSDASQCTYASVIQKGSFPTKEQAIVLDAYEDISIKDYIIAIGKAISPTNIRFASRIANNRICVYLSSKLLVDKIIAEKLNINVKGRSLSVRPLLMKAKRVILANVCPIIPHAVIEEILKKIDIRTLSPISFIKAGFSDPGFSHICSFRRQVFIHPDDEPKLPENLQISFDGTNYWIFVSTDKLTCFQCKKEGHMAKHCPTVVSSNDQVLAATSASTHGVTLSPTEVPAETVTIHANSAAPASVSTNITDHTSHDLVSHTKTTCKRPLSISSSASTTISDSLINESTFLSTVSPSSGANNLDLSFANPSVTRSMLTQKKKKLKMVPMATPTIPEDIDSALYPVKENLLLHPDAYVLNYSQFKELLLKAKGHLNIPQLAQSYTADLPQLIKMLRDTYSSLNSRSIKYRVTRIIKKLELFLNWSEDTSTKDGSSTPLDTDSDTESPLAYEDFSHLKDSPPDHGSI